MKRQIILFLLFLLVLSSLSFAYTEGRDVDTVEFYTLKKSFFIDFDSPLTDRWITPNNRVMFDGSGDSFIKFVEITPDRLELFVSNMDKTIYVEPDATETFTFGDNVITMTVLEAYNFKAHLDFSQEVKTTPVIETNKETEDVIETPVDHQDVPKEESSSFDDMIPSNIPVWAYFAVGFAILLGFFWFFKKQLK